MKKVKIYNEMESWRTDDDNEKEKIRKDRCTTNDPVELELRSWISKKLEWSAVLGAMGKERLELIGNDRNAYRRNWELIAKEFNIMEWWETCGKQSFPKIYIVACVVLPLPESNGSQERTFSTATWMDGKLNNRQTDKTFEMKVILHQNAEFLRKTKTAIKEEQMTRAEAAVKKACSAMEERAEIMEEDSEEDELVETEYYIEEEEKN